MKPPTWCIRPFAAAVSAVAALALAACGSSAAQQPQALVPSLPASTSAGSAGSAGATSTAATTGTSAAARPRITLDMANDQIGALYEQYNRCLAANGWSKSKNPRDQAAMTKAENACVGQDPLPPWQLDASNPKAGDFVHAVVQCLRDKGVKYVDATPEGGSYGFSVGGPDNDSQSISLGMQDIPACEKQVAAGGIGS